MTAAGAFDDSFGDDSFGDVSSDILERAKAIRLLVCDVDGVLTDGRIHFHEVHEGGDAAVREAKSFSTLDGLGIKLLQETGVIVALITGRRSEIVARRAREMGVRHVVQGADDKKRAWSTLLSELAIGPAESACIGDDWPDLAMIRACGLGITVAGASAVMRRHARYVTRAGGGNGAVREVCELIMTAQGTFDGRLEGWLG